MMVGVATVETAGEVSVKSSDGSSPLPLEVDSLVCSWPTPLSLFLVE